MQHEIVKLLKPFLEFLKTFDSCQVHNMLALMLDPQIKSLVGHGNAICLAIKYDVKNIIPFFMIIFN